MEILELTVPQFCCLGHGSLLIRDLQHIGDLAVRLLLVVYNLWLQVNHQPYRPCEL